MININTPEDTVKFLDRMIIDVYNESNIGSLSNITDDTIKNANDDLFLRFSENFKTEISKYFSDYGILQYTKRRILERFNRVKNSIDHAIIMHGINNPN